ncbi:MAG: hypothetical protein HRT88_14995 [Lentisphaeraceae bacterium]|nr:hypothetical protein [Lentisphaeraceae bacterium]
MSDKYIFLRDKKGKETKLKTFDITLKKLQLKSFTANSATLKDIYSSKVYVLEKGKQAVRYHRALVNYRGTTHRLRSSGNFFGYTVSITDDEISFSKGAFTDSINDQQKVHFLKEIPQNKSKHKLTGCSCYRGK